MDYKQLLDSITPEIYQRFQKDKKLKIFLKYDKNKKKYLTKKEIKL